MRLAEAGSAVDEERVVGLARRLRHRVRRGGGELVRLADDEGLEGVALVEGSRRDRGLVRARFGSRRQEEVHLWALLTVFLYAEHDSGGTAEHSPGGTRQPVPVLRVVPLHRALVRSVPAEAVV